MGLAKYLTRWIDVPHEPGERFQFRMPNWVIQEEARAARRRAVYGLMRETQEIVGADILREWKEQTEKDGAETTALTKAKTAEEVLNEFDRAIFLRAVIKDWTYCEPLRDEAGDPRYGDDGRMLPDRTKPVPVNAETIGDLDEQTQVWAGLTAIALGQSGFRPVLPTVEQNADGNVIDIRPGVDNDPLAYSSNSTEYSTVMSR